MARLVLVRHASHGLMGRVLAGRMPGVALSDAGRAEADGLAQALAGEPVRAVWTSPVQRAVETAWPIAARHGLVPIAEPGLEEVDFGDWTGQPFDALTGAAWEAWNRDRAMAMPPGGETMLAVQARAVATMHRAGEDTGADEDERAGEGVVVLVSHQDVIKAMLAYVLGMPLDLLHRFDVAPASRSIVRIGPGWAVVAGINAAPV